MVYVIIITFSISQVIQAGLAIYLFVQLQRHHRLLIEEAYPPLVGYTVPSAPLSDDAYQTNK